MRIIPPCFLNSKTLLHLFCLALLLNALGASAASVGPAGYTNDFNVQPVAADFATANIAGGSGDASDAATLDVAVAALTAAGINTQLPSVAGAPPAATATGVFNATDKNLQLRPTNVKLHVILATLVNNAGGNASAVNINYNLLQAAIAGEQVDGVRVYYSLTGVANSWVNVSGLNVTTAGLVSANVVLATTWTNGSPLYLLFVDDNGSPSPDTANQIDNFFIGIGAFTAELPVAITSQPQNLTVTESQSANFTVGTSGHQPITFQWYRGAVPIADATNASYTLTNAQVLDSGALFKAVAANVASNISYSVTSSVATLTVLGDTNRPTVMQVIPAADTAVIALDHIEVHFSEDVTGVDAADFLINNLPAANVTVLSPDVYAFYFAQPPTGTVQVAWAAGHDITDVANTPNSFAGGGWTYQLNTNVAAPSPYISEFMASNTRGLTDEDSEFSDWIEIYNPSTLPVNLDGWYLTDAINNLTKWRLPATNLASGGFLVVFASNKDRAVPGARLHTNFKLSASSEYLALVKPDGVTIAGEFRPTFPVQVPDVAHGFSQSLVNNLYVAGVGGVYFTTPTPGAPNLGGVTTPGPIIENVVHTPNVPLDNDNLLVTARVLPSFSAIGSVTLHYRIMFNNEVTAPMFDDGAHGDGAAGDGIYGASIAASTFTNGQMIRYGITASDMPGRTSQAPLFNDPLNSDQYFGTIVANPAITTRLPVFDFFLANPAAAETSTGTRCSLFYNGEFYDNIFIRIRGGTSLSWPKKSYKVELNEDHEFLLRPGMRRVTEFDLNTTYTDKSYVRAMLTYELQHDAGLPSPETFHVHLRQNTAFYSVALYVDTVDKDFAAKWGMDENGALYKGGPGSTMDTVASYEKKTRRLESNSDLQAFLSGLALSGAALENFVFDQVDVPELVNYMATMAVTQDIDGTDKNHYLHRDTLGSGEWRLLPWDLDLTFGPDALNTDTIVFQTQNTNGPACASHPFIGARPFLLAGGKYQRLIEAMVNTPSTRAMILRRTRTLTEQFLTTPYFQDRIEQLYTLINADVTADRAKWGASAHFGGATYTLRAALDRIKNEYLAPRPGYLLGTNIAGVGFDNPPRQPLNAIGAVISVDFNPVSGQQAQEYVCVSNAAPTALDISGWKLDGGVQFTFKPGTVVPSNSVVFVSPDVVAFRARTTGPRGGQGLFVVGPFQGQLSARGETVRVLNSSNQLLHSFTYPGSPSLAQQFLRITELMYHPAALAGNANPADEFEYIELKNTSTNVTLSLAGVRFTNGVDFSFTGSAVTSLAPGATVLVVKNTGAFTARYGGGFSIAGQYTGALDNSGERIQLIDAVSEEILDFSYNNSWYPVTAGLGFSLVILNEHDDPDAWSQKESWRASGLENGSPGTNDLTPPVFPTVLVNEVLANGALPQVDAIELFNSSTNVADISGWFLSDSLANPKKYLIPPGTVMAPGSFVVFYETNSFGATNVYTANGANAFGLGASGDDVYLFSGNGTNLTGYTHGFNFDASPTNVTYGRFEISTGPDIFVLQLSNTLGGPNSGPFVGPIAGPIVINEFMYDPTSPNSSFIELFNTSSNLTFDLSYWQLKGLSYTFPPGSFIGPRAYLVLAADRSSFAVEYGAAIPVFGTFSGTFSTNGETITLIQPGPTKAQDVIVDRVHYDNSAPWSTNASGAGFGFQLIDPLQDNSRVGNWSSSYFPGSYTPGTNLPGMLVPGFTNYNLRFVSVSGNIGNPSRLLLYLGEVGDVYIDDLYLASGGIAEAGTNLIVNGDFETPLLGAPSLTNFFTSVGSYHANSVIATTNAHSGNNSLRIVSTNNASFALTRILYKDIPGPTNGQLCTLSFLYRPTFGASNLYARFQSSTIGNSSIPTAVLTPPFAITSNMPPTILPPVTVLPSSIRTPGAANTNAATLPAFPPLWLNEVQAENLTGPTNSAGQHTAWLELYNASTNVITLTNLFLSGNYTNLTNWAFPAGATIAPGEFKIIFADGLTGLSTLSELHTSFSLTPGSGSLALSRRYNGQPQVIDYVNYTATAGRSYGSFTDGQSFDRQEFFIVTPRAANIAGLNTAPTLAPIASTSVNEGFLLSFTASANDTDVPAQTLNFSLSDQPPGASITSGGLFIWTPAANQAPSTNTIKIIVADNGTPSMSATQAFTVIVIPPPRQLTIARTNTTEVVLSWQAFAGRTYRVEHLETVDASGAAWTPIGAPLTATGDTLTFTDTIAPNAQRFYRVRQLQP